MPLQALEVRSWLSASFALRLAAMNAKAPQVEVLRKTCAPPYLDLPTQFLLCVWYVFLISWKVQVGDPPEVP